jgi:hypothetical protein
MAVTGKEQGKLKAETENRDQITEYGRWKVEITVHQFGVKCKKYIEKFSER